MRGNLLAHAIIEGEAPAAIEDPDYWPAEDSSW
jgi:hypothetical protein